MKIEKNVLIVLVSALAFSCVNNDETTPIPRTGVEQSTGYQVKINGKEVFVAYEECYGDSIFHVAICEIGNSSTVDVTMHATVENYVIRPASKQFKGSLRDQTITFKVDKPQMVVVEANNEKPLLIAMLPPESQFPDKDDPDVLYFDEGIHEPGIIRPTDGQTIYLAPGALVKGRIYGEDVSDVKVMGRGILDARNYTNKPEKICAIEFKNSENILVEGIGLRAGEWWQTLYLLCKNVEVSWMHLLSFGVNNDGIDIDGVTDFYAHDCFIGCGDDGFGWHAVDAEANGEPPTQNCLADNCVIYNTHAGNGLRVGASMETSLFKDITFRNIDVLEHANAGIFSDYSDWALSENVTFENFYIERPGRPIEVKIEKTRYSNATGFRDERGHIRNWKFINVQSPGGEIVLAGADDDHAIRNVLFKNCCLGGEPLQRESIIKNEYVFEVAVENEANVCLK